MYAERVFFTALFFIEDYEAALKFYSEKLSMNIRQRGTNLSILYFGGSCLMPGNIDPEGNRIELKDWGYPKSSYFTTVRQPP